MVCGVAHRAVENSPDGPENPGRWTQGGLADCGIDLLGVFGCGLLVSREDGSGA